MDFTDYANMAVKALPHGVLLTTKVADKVNTMTIGWGTIGINWGRPVFTAFIREGRFTRELLDANPEFTVSVPVGEAVDAGRIISICGTKSGRDTDKLKEACLTLVKPKVISVPAVKEFPLTFECKVLYRQTQNLSFLRDEKLKANLYPQDIDSSAVGANRDAHVTYFGEIVSCYIVDKALLVF